MTEHEALLQCDAQRRQAMISADVDQLALLLADSLTWTHSSGATEDKATFLSAIGSGAVVYEVLEIEQHQVRGNAEYALHNGILRGRASRDGQAKALNAKFLAVWGRAGDRWRLEAWQSTNCND